MSVSIPREFADRVRAIAPRLPGLTKQSLASAIVYLCEKGIKAERGASVPLDVF